MNDWKPPEGTDYVVRKWMSHRGWGVHRTGFDPEQQVYSWRHELDGGRGIVLRISRTALEDFPAFTLWEILDRLHVAAELTARPDACLVIVKRGLRALLEELPGESNVG